MRVATIRGIIDRRILVNFHVDPIVLSRILPPPFCARLGDGYGIVGISLIRLKSQRPRFLSSFVGVFSENAAHRITSNEMSMAKLKELLEIHRLIMSDGHVAAHLLPWPETC